MLRICPLFAAMTIAFSAGAKTPQKPEQPKQAAAAATNPADANPFLAPSTLPFQAPPFDKIKDSDYSPAFEEGMKQQIAEVEKIANNADTPTFDNTIVALERTGAAADARLEGVLRARAGEHERRHCRRSRKTSRRSSPRTRTRSSSTRSSTRA